MAKSELERALERLDELRRDGLLSDSEYATARQRAIQTSDLAAAAIHKGELDQGVPAPQAIGEGVPTPETIAAGREKKPLRGAWGRFRASRWWVKAVVVVIALFVLLIVLAAVFGEGDDTGGVVPAATSEEPAPSQDVVETSQPESTRVSTATSVPTARPTAVATAGRTVTPTAPATPDEPGLGDVVEVGSLELTLLEVDTYDGALEDSNYRVKVRVRKLKGDSYDFTGSSFKVIDAGGVAHDYDLSCRECPDNLFPGGAGIELLGTKGAERWVYFEIRSSDAPVQLRYKPTSRTAAVLFVLPSTPLPVVRASREPARSTPEPVTSTPQPATSPTEPEVSQPRIGNLVKVGSLELTVLAVGAYDTARHNPFNESTYRVLVRVRKHKGQEYQFSLFSLFTVIGTDGVGYDVDWLCVNCPDDLFADGGLTLYGDNAIERYLYFKLPGAISPVALRYEPGLSLTTEPVTIQMN